MAKKVRSPAKRRSILDNGIRYAFAMVSTFSVLVLILVAVFLFINAIPVFKTVTPSAFFFGTVWDPTNPLNPLYGIVPLFVATVLVTLVSTIIAVPIGLGCTIYLAELAHPKIKAVMKPAIEVLAGIPSVVLGFFALLVLATWIQNIFDPVNRLNLFVGGVMLSVMMIPIMVSLSEDAINSVPRGLKEASYALGTTRWETISKVILPAARPGIIAAVMLSIGRAVGETMVVVMACGNAPHLTFDIFSSGLTMTAAIANEMGEVAFNTTHYYALFMVGLVLFAITFSLNLVADWVLNRQEERY
ncbi:MAG TPA: phosphate ABC transporter permease subunit PstC [Methanomassiliicoccales archaeon]|nr:phosphate ABC transporter permease subunit PstC [Methanomassiliicoccales archaeon]